MLFRSAVSSLNSVTCQCPDLSSLTNCDCHITNKNDPTRFIPSGKYLTIACGDSAGASNGTMTDADAASLIDSLLSPTTPMEAIGIYYQPGVTRVPMNLKRFTYLTAVVLEGNRITSVDATNDLSWSWLQEINLASNAITSISGKFNMANNPSQMADYIIHVSLRNNALTSVNGDAFNLLATQSVYLGLGKNQITSISGDFNLTATNATTGKVELDLSNNQLTSLSAATFYMSGPYKVFLELEFNSLTSVTADRITLKGTRYIGLDLSYNQLTSVKLAPDSNPPLSYRQILYLYSNKLTGTIDCNDLGINSGVALLYLDVNSNQISGAKCGANTPLDSAQVVIMDWSYNSFTSLLAGSFNFAGNSYRLFLNDQNTAFTSIAPGALPSEFIFINALFYCHNFY